MKVVACGARLRSRQGGGDFEMQRGGDGDPKPQMYAGTQRERQRRLRKKKERTCSSLSEASRPIVTDSKAQLTYIIIRLMKLLYIEMI